MANTPDYSWPPMADRKIMGKPFKRLDGQQKASGRAKYTSDLKMKDLLYAAYVLCPHGHARVTAVDTSAAEKMKGVQAVHVVAPAGTEVQWHGKEIAAVAATTEEVAREAARHIKVEYEVMPHFVNEADLGKAGARGKAAGEKVTGDPEKAFQDAEAVSDGVYGIPVITHCCLEPHGAVVQWQGDQVMAWPSTQFVTGWANTMAPNLKVPAANIKVKMDYIGGGFGSKFSPGACPKSPPSYPRNAAASPSNSIWIALPSRPSPAIVRALSVRSKSPGRRTAPSPPGNPTPGRAVASPAADSPRCLTSTPTSPTPGSITPPSP